jgi:hypothetical protein
MSIKYVRIYSRKSTDTPFYQGSPSFLSYVQETYIDSGLCVSFRVPKYLDDEQLTVEFVSEWISKESIHVAKTDENLLQDNRNCEAYNTGNEIVLVSARVEDYFIGNIGL